MTLSLWRFDGAEWTDIDMTAQQIVDIKLQVSYAHAHMLSFTVLQPQHTLPFRWGDFIYFYDSDFGDLNNAVFEGHVHEIVPGESSSINYVCYDPTRRAGHEITIMSGPVVFANVVPRLVYNAKIENDEDKAFERRSDATVGEIIQDILADPYAFLEAMGAAPDASTLRPAYVQADLDAMTTKPQEKLSFESESLRSGLDRMLGYYPQYRVIFEPGFDRRNWRFRDVKAAPQLTLVLNQFTPGTKRVFSMNLQRSLERRYTAVKIYGPQGITKDEALVSDGSLTEKWTAGQEADFQQFGPGAAGAGDVSRVWQVTDNDKKALARILPEEALIPMFKASTIGTGLAFKRVKTPVLLANWGQGWEPINGLIFVDASQGIVASPYPVYKKNQQAPWYSFPSDVKLIFAYFSAPLTARYPANGYSGTAFDVFGMQVEMQRYDESLAIGYERGIPVTTAERTAQFEKLAQNIQEAHRDIVYTGGCTIEGIDYDFLFLNQRINFMAVDRDGQPLTTGWESIGAILTDVEYDYAERLTTLQFSSDHLEFTQTDPEELKRQLKIAATSPQLQIATAIVAVTRQGFTSYYFAGKEY